MDTQVIPQQPLNYALFVINMEVWGPYNHMIIESGTTKLLQADTTGGGGRVVG